MENMMAFLSSIAQGQMGRRANINCVILIHSVRCYNKHKHLGHRGVAANPDGGSQEELLEHTVSKLRATG